MSVSNFISLFGGVALFLFGMNLMGESLKKVAGSQLESILNLLSSTPLKGVLLGTGVTAIIQSSSATSVMVVGFVNSGVMKLRQAISVVMGAIIGTSITGWIICLSFIPGGSGWISIISTATLTGIVAVIGIVLRMFCKDVTKKNVADILLGFAVLMYGISIMSSAVSPLKESESFISLMTHFSNPFLGLIVGIAITSILQSASSSVGLLQALAITGAISFSTAFPLLLGMGIGAAVPVLLSSIGAGTDARRAAWSYLAVNVLGALVVGLLYYGLNGIFNFSFSSAIMNATSIAFVNTAYRFLAVLILFFFIPGIEKILTRLIVDKGDKTEQIEPPLDERFLLTPALAIEQSRKALFSMINLSRTNINDSLNLLNNYSSDLFDTINKRESLVDVYEDKLGNYLMRITASELNKAQAADVSKFLHIIGDLERISDHSMNIAQTAQEIKNKNIVFSQDATHELTVVSQAISECLSFATESFEKDNLDMAYHVEPLEELIDNLCDVLKMNHVERLQNNECTLSSGFVFNDLVTNFERVSDHCSNIALAVIQLDSGGIYNPHEYLESIKELKSNSFDKYYDEFSKKFTI